MLTAWYSRPPSSNPRVGSAFVFNSRFPAPSHPSAGARKQQCAQVGAPLNRTAFRVSTSVGLYITCHGEWSCEPAFGSDRPELADPTRGFIQVLFANSSLDADVQVVRLWPPPPRTCGSARLSAPAHSKWASPTYGDGDRSRSDIAAALRCESATSCRDSL